MLQGVGDDGLPRLGGRQTNILDPVGTRQQRTVDGLREVRRGDEKGIAVLAGEKIDAGERRIGGAVNVDWVRLKAHPLPMPPAPPLRPGARSLGPARHIRGRFAGKSVTSFWLLPRDELPSACGSTCRNFTFAGASAVATPFARPRQAWSCRSARRKGRSSHAPA